MGRDDSELPPRAFGWEDMFVAPEEDPRSEGGFEGEMATLRGYLNDYRATLGLKCAGLGPEQMAARSVPPSDLSLLGLVRHLASVEQYWFQIVLAGRALPRIFSSPERNGEAILGARPDPAAVEEAWAAWRAEVASADRYLDSGPDLSSKVSFPSGDARPPVSVREVLVHLIEEYARHMGHADLLRERIDGRVGQ